MTYGHLQADCLYTGISSGPNARYRVWEAFTFYLFTITINYYYLLIITLITSLAGVCPTQDPVYTPDTLIALTKTLPPPGE